LSRMVHHCQLAGTSCQHARKSSSNGTAGSSWQCTWGKRRARAGLFPGAKGSGCNAGTDSSSIGWHMQQQHWKAQHVLKYIPTTLGFNGSPSQHGCAVQQLYQDWPHLAALSDSRVVCIIAEPLKTFVFVWVH
jgi:hypothetical protein